MTCSNSELNSKQEYEMSFLNLDMLFGQNKCFCLKNRSLQKINLIADGQIHNLVYCDLKQFVNFFKLTFKFDLELFWAYHKYSFDTWSNKRFVSNN